MALAVRGSGAAWVLALDLRVGTALGGRGLPVAEAFSLVASWPVWTTLVLVGAACLGWGGARRAALVLALADVSTDVIVLVSKLLVDRTAPGVSSQDLETLLNGSLFPSGHVARATVTLGLGLALVLPRRCGWTRAAVPAAVALLLLGLGAARVSVHAHLASDVLGGYLLGGGWVELTLALALKGSVGRTSNQRRLTRGASDEVGPG